MDTKNIHRDFPSIVYRTVTGKVLDLDINLKLISNQVKGKQNSVTWALLSATRHISSSAEVSLKKEGIVIKIKIRTQFNFVVDL